jgi:uncharacterized Ntn-hydrolase superfamily protein
MRRLLALILPLALVAQAPKPPQRPVHTFSIVARDPLTGDLGVAVQSHWFSVGSAVPWAEAGVGAVATQSFTDPSYGKLGLDLMRAGKTAPEALQALLAADPEREVRQVAMVDARGNVAVHTGSLCIEAAGHEKGEAFTTEANMMGQATVWPAMAKAFRAAKGDLADRMLAALRAAQSEGGDFRGMQSAAILIVKGTGSGRLWADKVVDLRVEDHLKPIDELARLLQLNRAYALMNAGDEAVSKNDWTAALKAYDAAAKLAPQIPELPFWAGVALVNAGRVAEAEPILREVFKRDPVWRGALRRLAKVKQLPADEALLKRLEAL